MSSLILKLPGGQQLSFANQQEAQSFFERLSLSQHLSTVLTPDAVAVLKSHSQSMREQAGQIPQQIAELEQIVKQGKRDATLGQFGSLLDGAMSWADTAAEGAKMAPNPAAQLLGRTWLTSTQGTKSVIAVIQGKPGDATENALGALSQFPGLGALDKGKKGMGALNNGYEAGESIMAGEYDIAAAKITKGVAEGIEPDVAGSAVQSLSNTYIKKQEFTEMSDLKDSMDSTLESGRKNYQKLSNHLNTQADTNEVYAALAEKGRDPEVAQTIEAFKRQMPDVVRQAQEGNLNTLISDATEVARQNTSKAYRMEAPEKLGEFQAHQQELDSSAAMPAPTGEKPLYWFDPKDKDGFVNVRDQEGRYNRVSLEDAVEKGIVPQGTTTDQMTQYSVKDDAFLNDKNTSERFESRADRIAGTEYPDGMTMPGGNSRRESSGLVEEVTEEAAQNEGSHLKDGGGFVDAKETHVPFQTESQSRNAAQETGPVIGLPDSVAKNPAMPETIFTSDASGTGADWFKPKGAGGLLDVDVELDSKSLIPIKLKLPDDHPFSLGPTFENWGGGGWSGGVRDETPVCREDWKMPASKMDEAFRDHDYDYMRDGIDANTPQSNPLKQAADLRLLEKLKAIPDSELDANTLLFKTSTELFFGEKTSGKYDPELVEKLNNIPLSDLDLEEKAAKLISQGKIQKDELEKFVGDLYETTKTKISDAADYLGDKANEAGEKIGDAADYVGDKINEASDFAKEKAEQLGESLSSGYDSLTDKLSSLISPASQDTQPKWEGGGGSFGGGGASGSWDTTAEGMGVLGGEVGGGVGTDKSISVIQDEADEAAQAADTDADRAESAARRAESALRRAQRARARIMARLRRPCWVARAVYGEQDPRWRMFRVWLMTEAPAWFRNLYIAHGEQVAKFIEHHPLLKMPIRLWMDRMIASPMFVRCQTTHQVQRSRRLNVDV